MVEGNPAPSAAYSAYLTQAQKLSLKASPKGEDEETFAKSANFITPNDPVIETQGGEHLPPVPVEEAEKLNKLEQLALGEKRHGGESFTIDEDTVNEKRGTDTTGHDSSALEESTLGNAKPTETTNPLFPPLPLYGPPSLTRNLQSYIFRITTFCCTINLLTFLFIIGIIPSGIKQVIGGEKETARPFYEEEKIRRQKREAEEKSWEDQQRRKRASTDNIEEEATQDPFPPTEGGKDPLVCDVAYYARRVGLDAEEYQVQTEDGFLIELWHIYNPKEYTRKSEQHRAPRGPDVFKSSPKMSTPSDDQPKRKYPVLMIHGLLQSSGAYCAHDDNSIAFYLAKSNYDVWLGNNRCGFSPKHTLFSYNDPRMWTWNVRHMGVFDLPALISRVLHETGFPKLGLVGHSQGTTQTLIALSKDQRPELGKKISVFCALAPAAYAGPIVDKWFFGIFKVLSQPMYKIVFGIHAFMPAMISFKNVLPPGLYGFFGYCVFTYLFNWSDRNWDKGLRNRGFMFSPTYTSAESMRWWLGGDGFKQNRCILAMKEEVDIEDVGEEAYDEWVLGALDSTYSPASQKKGASALSNTATEKENRILEARKAKAWYDDRVPPMALWVAGNDGIVDGRRLLHRFQRNRKREPCVRVVREKVIEEYQHLDVIWAIDCIEQVGKEVKEVIWSTLDSGVREQVIMVRGCEALERWVDPGVVVV